MEMVVTNAIPLISSRWVSGLLARLKIRPHRIDHWMFSKDKVKDPNFDVRVGLVCQAWLFVGNVEAGEQSAMLLSLVAVRVDMTWTYGHTSKTIKTHLVNIIEKLYVTSRTGAVIRGVNLRLIQV